MTKIWMCLICFFVSTVAAAQDSNYRIILKLNTGSSVSVPAPGGGGGSLTFWPRGSAELETGSWEEGDETVYYANPAGRALFGEPDDHYLALIGGSYDEEGGVTTIDWSMLPVNEAWFVHQNSCGNEGQTYIIIKGNEDMSAASVNAVRVSGVDRTFSVVDRDGEFVLLRFDLTDEWDESLSIYDINVDGATLRAHLKSYIICY